MFFEIAPKKDFGEKTNIINIRKETMANDNFRKAIWTGKHLQITVMSIPVGGEIGLEMHDNLDQFIKLESGCAGVYMGDSKQNLKYIGKINANYGVVIPAGSWHNIINACACPLKVYSIYAPPQHPPCVVHKTKLDSDLAEG